MDMDHDQALSGSSQTLWLVFIPKIFGDFLHTKEKVYLLLIKSSLRFSLDPLFHSDNIIDQVNAEEMNAFPYY